jgi:LmbE family N-acetylglucosaminyl deacetylase
MLEYLKNKKVLVLAAHPDDETLGCGATIHKLSSLGCDIEVITFTDGVGSRNNNESDRNPKLQAVSNILGIKKYTSGNFPDNAMDSVPLLDLCKFIEENTDDHYDLIFTHYTDDLNVDHGLVTKAALTAFRPQNYISSTKMYAYYVPSSTDYNPLSIFDGNTYYSVSIEDVNAKYQALRIYDNEMRNPPHSRSYTNVSNLMEVWGAEAGCSFSEKFKLIREII